MSRITTVQTNQPIAVAPSDNIYTVLALAASVALVLGVLVLFIKAKALGVQLF